ncbi:MAG TPA: hypothetical protein VNT54_06085 [Solirubrobacteraceae bacterium]|nr:hypothetical protein [Solirubrobacteraceae bacterium]
MPDLNVIATPADAPDDAVEPAHEWGGTLVPAGHTVATGYVEIHQVVCLAGQGSQLHPAEVERAYRRQLALVDAQTWPPPTGYWRHDRRFVLTDGRNRYVAALMLGVQHLFVAWLCPPAADP